MILRKEPDYHFSDISFSTDLNADFFCKNCYLAFPLPSSSYLSTLTGDTVLLDIPGVFTLRLMNRSYRDADERPVPLRYEGCFSFNEENEWILEARCTMTTSDNTFSDVYALRLPLSAPFAREGEIGFYFDGVWLRFMKDGRILNENSGLDCFAPPCGQVHIAPAWEHSFRFGHVKEVSVCYTETEEECNADFYSPADWNVYAGDAMNYYHNGVYHLLFLRDRRHHLSRNGNGAHDIAHLTTSDLTHWTEQEPLAVIDKPWMTYGTGTMLFHQGKYYMTYGFHTERHQSKQEKVVPILDTETQTFSPLSCTQLLRAGKVPGGASYSVSEDGIHFSPSDMLYHPGTNPSTYAMPDGTVKMYVGYRGDGIWISDAMEKPFRKSNEDFSFVNSSVMKNTTECPSFFEWNGYRYLIIGFTGYYRILSDTDDVYTDMVGKEEIYDGLCVPMVTAYHNNRRLIAGWLNGVGWGSVIVHRELIQEEGGRLGMKWVPELVPETIGENLMTSGQKISVSSVRGAGYLLEATIEPKQASRMGIQFSKGETACELQLDFEKQRMQMMDTKTGVLADSLPTTYEIAKKAGDALNWLRAENENWPVARNSKNFCMANIFGTDKPFTLRILVRYSRKLRSTVIDAEVAGRRTMVSVRDGFFPDTFSVLSDGDISMRDCAVRKLKSPIA